jgi:hypothetical protein
LGHARHGKDTVAEWLRDNRGLSFESSSYFAAKTFLFDKMINDGYHYDSVEDCFNDRVNQRGYWYKSISKFNNPKDRLAKMMLEVADTYVGMRCKKEFLTCMGYDLPKWWQFWKNPTQVREPIFDLVIWVDAFERKPLESKKSMNITFYDVYSTGVEFKYVGNNTTLENLHKQLSRRF